MLIDDGPQGIEIPFGIVVELRFLDTGSDEEGKENPPPDTYRQGGEQAAHCCVMEHKR